jgi:hypothetical protein
MHKRVLFTSGTFDFDACAEMAPQVVSTARSFYQM